MFDDGLRSDVSHELTQPNFESLKLERKLSAAKPICDAKPRKKALRIIRFSVPYDLLSQSEEARFEAGRSDLSCTERENLYRTETRDIVQALGDGKKLVNCEPICSIVVRDTVLPCMDRGRSRSTEDSCSGAATNRSYSKVNGGGSLPKSSELFKLFAKEVCREVLSLDEYGRWVLIRVQSGCHAPPVSS